MAWIFLAASEDCLSHFTSGSSQSPIVKETDTLRAFCSIECETARLKWHRSGMTFALSTNRICQWCLISFLADFHARTLVLPELERAWRESEVVFSLKSSDWCVSFDRDSFSWKTSQLSLFGGLIEFSWSSLRWGMIRDGQLYQPQALEPVTKGIDGSYLPTPTASVYGSNTSTNSTNKRMGLMQLASKGRLPTPVAHDAKAVHKSDMDRNSPSLAALVGGSLNPQLVEEIMGYGIGWTDLSAWATQWFRSKQKKRLKGCAV